MRNEKPTPLNPPLSGGKRESSDGKYDTSTHHHFTTTSSSPDKGRSGGVKGFIPYDKRLTALARENRNNPTAPESRMWNEVLRMRHFSDYKFLRQKPIADFIVDFYCAELRLAIEIDGDSHAGAIKYDAVRTAVLKAHGISVVRYYNDEVMKNLEGVYDDLARRIALVIDGAAEQ